jgi:putative colanic acid biosynthesis UDP-glucose lipid carrier transferase
MVARGMLKQSSSFFDAVLRVADPLLVAISGVVAYRIYLGSWDMPGHYVSALLAATLAAFLLFPAFRLYQSQRGMSFIEEARGLFLTWLLLAVTGGAYLFLTKTGAEYSRGWALLWTLGGVFVHIATRAVLRGFVRSLRRHGRNLRHVLIVGAGPHARSVAARLREAAWAGLSVRAFYDDEAPMSGTLDGIPIITPIARITEDLQRDLADQVWIALPLTADRKIRDTLAALSTTPAVVRFVPDIYGFQLLNHSVAEIAGLPVLNLTDTPLDGVAGTWKRVEDYVFAALLLVALSPLLLLVALGVKLSSPGPVLFRQQRVTWNGRHFDMLKFRTMPVAAERASGPVWSRHGDPRATRFGAFLRRFSLDELPQLFNVLKGEMSLVGPRPERPEFVEQFRRDIPGYMQKHLVKAGVTGWAQVNDLRGNSDLVERINYDLYYIEHWSIWFDLRILALTLWHILTSRNAH